MNSVNSSLSFVYKVRTVTAFCLVLASLCTDHLLSLADGESFDNPLYQSEPSRATPRPRPTLNNLALGATGGLTVVNNLAGATGAEKSSKNLELEKLAALKEQELEEEEEEEADRRRPRRDINIHVSGM